jgi:hypothetical protein
VAQGLSDVCGADRGDRMHAAISRRLAGAAPADAGLQWLCAAVTPQKTVYAIQPRRGLVHPSVRAVKAIVQALRPAVVIPRSAAAAIAPSGAAQTQQILRLRSFGPSDLLILRIF